MPLGAAVVSCVYAQLTHVGIVIFTLLISCSGVVLYNQLLNGALKTQRWKIYQEIVHFPFLSLGTVILIYTILQQKFSLTYHKLVHPRAPCISNKNSRVVGKRQPLLPSLETCSFCLSTVHVETHLILFHHHLTGNTDI